MEDFRTPACDTGPGGGKLCILVQEENKQGETERMRILYTTDIHGRTHCFDTVLERAATAGATAIVYGGDLMPLGPDLFAVQQAFLGNWLPEYIQRCARRGIALLATLGNMDLRGLDGMFGEVMNSAGNSLSLLDESAEFGGYTFVGCTMTTDGPFSLKDRCLRDLPDSVSPFGGGSALASGPGGIHRVDNWARRVTDLPSLAEHLNGLPLPENPQRTIYVIHQPPAGAGLGIIDSGVDVGSQAVKRFLEKSGALLSLHGHIHESPFSGGTWRAALGGTTCVQPGQLSGQDCVSVLIDLPDLKMERQS
jgi:uncharacterized protein